MNRIQIAAGFFAVANALPSFAQASQGPGAGPGTASDLTQNAMAFAVYGAAAAIGAAALIRAVWRAR